MSDTDLATVLGGARLLPVLTVPSTKMAGPLAEALAVGGARCAEVTFRTPGAERVLKEMAAHGGLAVGAGTVLTPGQAERAVAAGARFVVSPGFDEEVVATCGELGVPVVPGIATATELMRALRGRPRHRQALSRRAARRPADTAGARGALPRDALRADRRDRRLPDGRLPRRPGGPGRRRQLDGHPAHLERGDYDEIHAADRGCGEGACRDRRGGPGRGDAALRPGRGTHPHHPLLPGLGGRRRVQRRPRTTPLLRPAHSRRDRPRRQRRGPTSSRTSSSRAASTPR